MIQSINPDASLFLTNLERIQRKIDAAQRQLSSGVRLERASDDPAAVVEVLQLQTDVSANDQIRRNLEREKTEVDVGERVLQEAVRLAERATVLGAQASGSLMSPEQRTQILEEVRGIHEQMVAVSQAVVNGRYIFSGDNDQGPVYTPNPAGSGGVQRLQTTAATREVQEPGGTTFVAARTAHEIFDSRDTANQPTQENVFVAIQSLIDALATNSTAGIDAAMSRLRNGAGHLNSQLSHYGACQNRLAAAISAASRYDTQFRTRLSQNRDADLAVVATELSQARLHQEATIAAQANGRRRSLFDYLG